MFVDSDTSSIDVVLDHVQENRNVSTCECDPLIGSGIFNIDTCLGVSFFIFCFFVFDVC